MAWRAACIGLLLLAAPGLQAAPKAHDHGVASLSVAIDGRTLRIEFEAPLDSLLGFERPPRTDAERRSAVMLLALLHDGVRLFVPDADARCLPQPTTLQAPALQPGAHAAGDHADLLARISFHCGRPQALRSLKLGLFQAFDRLQRIDVQIVGPQGQHKASLRPPASMLNLQR